MIGITFDIVQSVFKAWKFATVPRVIAAGICIATLTGTASMAQGGAPQSQKDLNRDEAKKHFNKAFDLHQSGFFTQAINEYKSSIAIDDQLESSWCNLAIAYTAQRNYPKGIDAFEHALKIDPNSVRALNGLGSLLYAQGKTSEARARWAQVLRVDPGFSAAYYNMANSYETEHNITKAIEQYSKAIERDPKQGESFYRLANLYLKDKHLAQARVMFANSVMLGPDSEYLIDAKKQLASIDAALAADDRANNNGT